MKRIHPCLLPNTAPAPATEYTAQHGNKCIKNSLFAPISGRGGKPLMVHCMLLVVLPFQTCDHFRQVSLSMWVRQFLWSIYAHGPLPTRTSDFWVQAPAETMDLPLSFRISVFLNTFQQAKSCMPIWARSSRASCVRRNE